MNELTIFTYENNEVRTSHQNGETWWVLKDVCDALGLSDTSKVAERLDSDELTRIKIVSGGQSREMYAVNESGLYNVIVRSDKPEAKAFKRWVTHEVLPSIRKHGAYMTAETIESAILNPDTIIRIATALKDEQEKNKELTAKVEADKPKVLFADAVSVAKTTILVGEMAKLLKQNGIDIGQNRLFEWLRDNGYLIRRKGVDFNMPTQRAMEMGLFEIKETAINHSDGHISINKTPKLTGRGQQYIVDKFLSRVS